MATPRGLPVPLQTDDPLLAPKVIVDRGIPLDSLEILDGIIDHEKIKGEFAETGRRLDGIRWQHTRYPLTVIASLSIEHDGKLWLHVSYAHPKRMPTHDETTKVKDTFIGEGRYAIAVYPPKDYYVNRHPYCLHLWHCMDGHPLPEFSGITDKGERIV